MATAKQFREQPLESGVDVGKSLTETGARLAIDSANGALECRQRIIQVRELRIEIFLALRLLLELIDGGKVYWT